MKPGPALEGPGWEAIISPASLRRLFFMYIDICKSGSRLFIYKLSTNMHKEVKRLQKIAGLLEAKKAFVDLTNVPKFSAHDVDEINNLPVVSLKIGRIERGGNGIQGTYDQFKDTLTRPSREKIDAIANKLGITWNEMIVYYDIERHWGGTSIHRLFAILGRDQTGKLYMYDRAGIGPGAYSKLYSLGGTRVLASAALNMTPQDFKEDRESL